jgi:hypothetical protein
MARWQKVNRPIEEWACAENNLGYEQSFKLQEYPMPVANTVQLPPTGANS